MWALDGSSDEVIACKRILEKVGLKGYQIGKTKVFLQAGQMADLDTHRSEGLGKSSSIIKRKVHTYLAHRRWFVLSTLPSPNSLGHWFREPLRAAVLHSDVNSQRHPLRPYLDYVGYLYQKMDPLPKQRFEDILLRWFLMESSSKVLTFDDVGFEDDFEPSFNNNMPKLCKGPNDDEV
ncbi:Myosin-6 [Glycine soja]